MLYLILVALILYYWWESGVYKGRARRLATEHCRSLGLQLLDDGMVITGIRPARNAAGRLVLRRSYRFEFASTGDRRYRGRIVLDGLEQRSIELDPYKIPGDGIQD